MPAAGDAASASTRSTSAPPMAMAEFEAACQAQLAVRPAAVKVEAGSCAATSSMAMACTPLSCSVELTSTEDQKCGRFVDDSPELSSDVVAPRAKRPKPSIACSSRTGYAAESGTPSAMVDFVASFLNLNDEAYAPAPTNSDGSCGTIASTDAFGKAAAAQTPDTRFSHKAPVSGVADTAVSSYQGLPATGFTSPTNWHRDLMSPKGGAFFPLSSTRYGSDGSCSDMLSPIAKHGRVPSDSGFGPSSSPFDAMSVHDMAPLSRFDSM